MSLLAVAAYVCTTVSATERVANEHYPNPSSVLFPARRSPHLLPILSSVSFSTAC